MFEGGLNVQSESVDSGVQARINELDTSIADMIDEYRALGLPVEKWNTEYENLPNELSEFKEFYDRLYDFKQEREDALTTFEFSAEMSEEEKASIRQFDSEVRAAYKDHEHFLGNGATAEVYAMSENDAVCVKFITNQEQYDLNNHLRTEFNVLSHVYEHTKESAVRAPYPIFLRLHAKQGHSFGMEKVDGASLSQILESPEAYPELLAIAQTADATQVTEKLLGFVSEMHEAGVTHCDLYKRNLMLDREGNLFVIDFGKAKKENFVGERGDERKSDIHNARHSLNDFFMKLNKLTSTPK